MSPISSPTSVLAEQIIRKMQRIFGVFLQAAHHIAILIIVEIRRIMLSAETLRKDISVSRNSHISYNPTTSTT